MISPVVIIDALHAHAHVVERDAEADDGEDKEDRRLHDVDSPCRITQHRSVAGAGRWTNWPHGRSDPDAGAGPLQRVVSPRDPMTRKPAERRTVTGEQQTAGHSEQPSGNTPGRKPRCNNLRGHTPPKAHRNLNQLTNAKQKHRLQNELNPRANATPFSGRGRPVNTTGRMARTTPTPGPVHCSGWLCDAVSRRPAVPEAATADLA